MLKFSIIIPVYNSEVYLKRVVDSILEQSFSDFEAIFINDGSKDKSLEILKEYEKTRILLCGFYGVINYGDDLMMRGIIKAINQEKVDLTIMICGNEETDFSAYPNVNVIYLPIQKIDIKLMANYYDGIIWGGGALIDDGNYNYANYNLNLSTIFIHLTKAFQIQNKMSIIY